MTIGRFYGILTTELSTALRAPIHWANKWNGESRINTLKLLSSDEHLRLIEGDKCLIESIDEHTKLFQDTLGHPSSVPVFYFNPSLQKNPFKYAGTIGKLFDELSRKAILEGNYIYKKELLEIKTGPLSVKPVDVIIAGKEFEVPDLFLDTLMTEKILAASRKGLPLNASYSDTLVYRFNGNFYTHIGCLGLLPNIHKQLLGNRNFTIISRPIFHKKITHLSEGKAKYVSIIVLGVKNLWETEFRENRRPRIKKVDEHSRKKEIPPIDNSPLKLSTNEIVQTLSSPNTFKKQEKIGLRIICELPSGETVEKNKHLMQKEYAKLCPVPMEYYMDSVLTANHPELLAKFAKINSARSVEYLKSVLIEHGSKYPEEFPVFVPFQMPYTFETVYIYAGPVSNLYDTTAHQDILNWNYQMCPQFFDDPNTNQQIVMDAIFTGNQEVTRNTLASLMIRSALHKAAHDELKWGDHYCDINIHLYNDQDKEFCPFHTILTRPLTDDLRAHILNGNYTIFPNCHWYTTIVYDNKNKMMSNVVLGTKTANIRNFWTPEGSELVLNDIFYKAATIKSVIKPIPKDWL